MKVVVSKMIGIIAKGNVYPLLIEISSKKNTNIYLYSGNSIELGIEKLKQKNCNIIITDQDFSKVNNRDIKFINMNITPKDDEYLLDNKELVLAINEGNEEKVISILDNIEIPKEKSILITNPVVLLIKHIIEARFENKIVTINDVILNEISKENEEGQIYLIN